MYLSHEHQHPNAPIKWNIPAVYRYYSDKDGWDDDKIKRNVIDRADVSKGSASHFDHESIMEYAIPKELTLDGFHVDWNTKLSNTDKLFISNLYPGRYRPFSMQTGTALHETGDNFELMVAGNRDIFAIKKTGTGSNSTEVHVLSASSGYKNFSLQTGTCLHQAGNEFQFCLAPNNDVFAIKKSSTGSNSTEVHVLSAESGYKRFSLQTGTCLHNTGENFQFCLGPNRDLYAIKKSGTGTNSTEVHVLLAEKGYRQFSRQTGTALHETGDDFDFGVDANKNLVAIKKSGTGSCSTEVHVLPEFNNYSTFMQQIKTRLHETGPNFEFGVAPNGDVFCFKKSQTGTNSTEVHILKR